jgi:hypothetical protein
MAIFSLDMLYKHMCMIFTFFLYSFQFNHYPAFNNIVHCCFYYKTLKDEKLVSPY